MSARTIESALILENLRGQTTVANRRHHMLSLYAGCPGGRAWRRHIAEHHARWDSAALSQLAHELDAKKMDALSD